MSQEPNKGISSTNIVENRDLFDLLLCFASIHIFPLIVMSHFKVNILINFLKSHSLKMTRLEVRTFGLTQYLNLFAGYSFIHE